MRKKILLVIITFIILIIILILGKILINKKFLGIVVFNDYICSKDCIKDINVSLIGIPFAFLFISFAKPFVDWVEKNLPINKRYSIVRKWFLKILGIVILAAIPISIINSCKCMSFF